MDTRIVVDSIETFGMLKAHIADHRTLAYDVESTGVNVRKDKVIGFSVSGKPGIGFYLPLWSWNGESLVRWKPELLKNQDIKELFKLLQTKRLIMHNASFDVRITKQSLGIDLLDALYADTMLLKHTCDENFPFGLKEIAVKIQDRLGFDAESLANREQLDLKEHLHERGASSSKGNYELYKGDTYIIGKYAAADADLTMRIYNHYAAQLFEDNLDKFFFQDEVMPLYKEVTIPMEERGIPLDMDKLTAAKQEIDQDLSALENEIQSQIEPLLGDFKAWFLNLKYPVSTKGEFPRHLAELLGLELPRTASGKLSLTAKNIAALEDGPFKAFMQGVSRLPENLVRRTQTHWHGPAHMFNLSSKHHLKKLFFQTLREEPLSRTDKGNPQIDDTFLESVAEKYSFVPLLLDYNKLTKIRGTYIDRFIEEQEDGVFYPSFQQHRTVSGRYGSDFQQLPRPLEPGQASDLVIRHNNRIRELFISGPGYVFIDDDYESLEPHVFAHVSGDPGLISIFQDRDTDFYSTIAIRTENLEGYSANKRAENYLGKVDKPKRQKAKSYSLGIPYGMSGYKLSFEIGVDVSEADQLVEDYLSAFPKLREWMDASRQQVLTRGYIDTQAGRRRRFPEAVRIFRKYADAKFNILEPLSIAKNFNKGSEAYNAVREDYKTLRNCLNNGINVQIQGLAASIVNRACIAITRHMRYNGIDGYICAQIHDQLVVRVREDQAQVMKEVVQCLMENTYQLSVPLKAPAEIGRNLREAH